MKHLFLCLLLGLVVVGGCNKDSGPPLNAEQEKQATRLDELAKKSGGDWSKLSADEQKEAVLLGGSEQGAKMLLLGKAGKIGNHPGGPGGQGTPGGPSKPAGQ
ncbi:MAG TPA: hypothetical protein VKT78_04955 [Fimbriimonadaceae bacterium]|nr:hypothetical protein [Fimbriimonadaceae bacterium]